MAETDAVGSQEKNNECHSDLRISSIPQIVLKSHFPCVRDPGSERKTRLLFGTRHRNNIAAESKKDMESHLS